MLQQKKRSPQNPKSYQLRLQIRNRQIEEYKKKIRTLYGDHKDQKTWKNERIEPDMQNEHQLLKQHGIDMRMCNLNDFSSAGKCKYSQIGRIGMQLAQLADKIKQSSQIQQQVPECQINCELKQQYHHKLDELLLLILLVEEDRELKPTEYQNYMLQILQITTSNSTKIHEWKMQQRCIVSFIYQCYLSSLIKAKTYTASILYELQMCMDYLWNILNSQPVHSNQVQNNQNVGSSLDFNEVEELIMQDVVEICNQLMLKNSYQIENREQLDRNRYLIDTILRVYSGYFSRYVKELKEGDPIREDEDKNIGNIKLEVVKSLLNLSRAIITNLANQPDPTYELYEQMRSSINKTIDLYSHLTSIICNYPIKDFRSLEDSTSETIFGTVVGFIFQLCDHIAEIGERMGENESYDEADRYQGGIWWMSGIKNRQLVRILRKILQKDIYIQKCINELYVESGLSIYLLTCIFMEFPQTEQQSNQLRQVSAQKIKLELECLKLIRVLYDKYEIIVDQENNLSLRYLEKRGNSELNLYYFQNLARIRKNS